MCPEIGNVYTCIMEKDVFTGELGGIYWCVYTIYVHVSDDNSLKDGMVSRLSEHIRNLCMNVHIHVHAV